MEFSSWLRVGAIAALFFGSIWVLLPTVFRESAESRFQRDAEQIQSTTHTEANLDVTLPVTSGDPVAVSNVVKKRLAVGPRWPCYLLFVPFAPYGTSAGVLSRKNEI